MNKGQLISWNDDKGYGFIRCDALAQDTFIHISTLKTMSRKPKVGDFIYFDTEKQNNGKIAAINCRIEGVLALKTPIPIPRKNKQSSNKGFKVKAIQFLLIFSIIITIFSYINQNTTVTQSTNNTPINRTDINTFKVPKTTQYSCDGRQYCSEMNSREEAFFFIQHCPNTKMDGDNDGRPCENDSRF